MCSRCNATVALMLATLADLAATMQKETVEVKGMAWPGCDKTEAILAAAYKLFEAPPGSPEEAEAEREGEKLLTGLDAAQMEAHADFIGSLYHIADAMLSTVAQECRAEFKPDSFVGGLNRHVKARIERDILLSGISTVAVVEANAPAQESGLSPDGKMH